MTEFVEVDDAVVVEVTEVKSCLRRVADTGFPELALISSIT